MELLIARYLVLRARLLPHIKCVATTNLVWTDGQNKGKVDCNEVVCLAWFDYEDALRLTKKVFYNDKFIVNVPQE